MACCCRKACSGQSVSQGQPVCSGQSAFQGQLAYVRRIDDLGRVYQGCPAYEPGPVYPIQKCTPNSPEEDGECTGNLHGGWSSFAEPTADDIAVFEAALKHIDGVGYTPLYVSKQVVAGLNYFFIAKGISTTLYPHTGIYTISVFRALNGRIILGAIKSINPQ